MTLLMVCLAGMFTGNAYWCKKLGYWNDLGKGRLKVKVFVTCCRWDQRVRKIWEITAGFL